MEKEYWYKITGKIKASIKSEYQLIRGHRYRGLIDWSVKYRVEEIMVYGTDVKDV